MSKLRNAFVSVSLLFAGILAGAKLHAIGQANNSLSGFEPRLAQPPPKNPAQAVAAEKPENIDFNETFDAIFDDVFVVILIAGCIGCVFIAAKYVRRTNRSSRNPSERPTAALVLSDANVNRAESAYALDEITKVPRELANNPYRAAGAHLTFDERVRIAALGSVQAGRVIGAIQFKLALPNEPETDGQSQGSHGIAHVAERFARNLRGSDGVIAIEPDEIIVFVSLLSRRRELEDIALRLRRVLVKEGLGDRILHAGIAMYPIDGYSSRELIDAARAHQELMQPDFMSNPSSAPPKLS